MKSENHTEQTLNHFYMAVSEKTRIPPEKLVQITEFLLGALVRRLHYSGAWNLISHLPRGLQDDLLDLPAGPDSSITLVSIEQELATRFELEKNFAASLIPQFFSALTDLTDPRAMADIRALLPPDIRSAFPEEPHGQSGSAA